MAGNYGEVQSLKDRHKVEMQRQAAMLDDLERTLAESKARVSRLEQENIRLSAQASPEKRSLAQAASSAPGMPNTGPHV